MEKKTNVIHLQISIYSKTDPFLIKFSVTISEFVMAVCHAYHIMSGRFEKEEGLEIKIYRKNKSLNQYLVNFEP